MIGSLFNFIPGGSEWIIVIVAAGVLLFGAKKIPELAKTFGKAKGEYKKGEIEADKELKQYKSDNVADWAKVLGGSDFDIIEEEFVDNVSHFEQEPE